MHALCLPLGASVSLLVMFFFFDSMQMLFAVCTAIIATVALAFLLLPMCQYIIRPCSDGNRISFGFCGRFTAAELFSFSLAVSIVCVWVLTGHWLLMDGMNRNSNILHNFFLNISIVHFFLFGFFCFSHGYGIMCCIHCICSITKSQGVDTITHRTIVVRCFLGVLFIVYIQYKCDG